MLLSLAVSCNGRKQHTAAIQCLLGVLSNNPPPDDKFQACMLLADTYVRWTHNLADARTMLNSLVRNPTAAPGSLQLLQDWNTKVPRGFDTRCVCMLPCHSGHFT